VDSCKGVRIKYHTGLISASPLLMETLRQAQGDGEEKRVELRGGFSHLLD